MTVRTMSNCIPEPALPTLEPKPGTVYLIRAKVSKLVPISCLEGSNSGVEQVSASLA